MVQLFGEIRAQYRDRAPPAPSPPGWCARLPSEDAAVTLIAIDDPDAIVIDHRLRGMAVILNYFDVENVESLRKVTCSRLAWYRGGLYLRAFCHERRAPRTFSIGGIASVYDVVTGERLDDGGRFFGAFMHERVADGAGEWGLSERARASLGAGLLALTFLARCDGHVHPSELDEIESFAASWWIRAEISVDIPEADILARARRIAPDVDLFEWAARHVRHDRVLQPLVAGYARRLVEADGWLTAQEQHWITKLIAWWEEA